MGTGTTDGWAQAVRIHILLGMHLSSQTILDKMVTISYLECLYFSDKIKEIGPQTVLRNTKILVVPAIAEITQPGARAEQGTWPDLIFSAIRPEHEFASNVLLT